MIMAAGESLRALLVVAVCSRPIRFNLRVLSCAAQLACSGKTRTTRLALPVRTAAQPQPTSPDTRALTYTFCNNSWSDWLHAARVLTVERDIDSFLITHGKNHGSYQTYSGLLSLCISDVAKPLLLHNPAFIPHLVRGTLLTHVPRCVLRSVNRVYGDLAGCSDGLPRCRSGLLCCL